MIRRLLIVYGARALMVAPLVWVATELGRTYLFTGFPWVLLGYSQATTLPVAQFASIVGVYGVSALVASVERRRRDPGGDAVAAGRGAAIGIAVAACCSLAVTAWGSAARVASRADAGGRADPGRTDPGQRRSGGQVGPRGRAAAIFQDYLRMTRQAIGSGAELVLWPESSTPFMFEEDAPAAEQVRTLAREARVPILFGSDQSNGAGDGRRCRIVLQLGVPRAAGRHAPAGVYRKMHLVPFGEYVPLKKLLFFAAPLVEAVGADFVGGTDATLLPVGGHPVSMAICYEVVYPDLVRQFVQGGSELLTTITNDAWFGRTSAPYQHFEQASMRAIENGRYLVRAANTGISGIVDPYGRVLAQTEIFEPAVIVARRGFSMPPRSTRGSATSSRTRRCSSRWCCWCWRVGACGDVDDNSPVITDHAAAFRSSRS